MHAPPHSSISSGGEFWESRGTALEQHQLSVTSIDIINIYPARQVYKNHSDFTMEEANEKRLYMLFHLTSRSRHEMKLSGAGFKPERATPLLFFKQQLLGACPSRYQSPPPLPLPADPAFKQSCTHNKELSTKA